VFAFSAPFKGSGAADPTMCAPNTTDRFEPNGTCWSMAATLDGQGYWILNGDTGIVHTFGDATFAGDPAHASFPDAPREFVPNGVAIVTEPNGNGYWVLEVGLSGLGSVVPLGSSGYFGDEVGQQTPHDGVPVGMAATPDGGGYWIVDSDGAGYFLVAADGGVFAFGDAQFAGSMGGAPLNAPMAGIAVDPTSGGYWLAAADGGVFSFGGAIFRGSMAGEALNQPVFAIVASPVHA
jgi:hypothetical protein